MLRSTWFQINPSFLRAPAPSRIPLPDVLSLETVLLPVLRHQCRPPDHLLQRIFAGIIISTVPTLQIAENPVPFWETSSPAGGSLRPPCRFVCSFSTRRVEQPDTLVHSRYSIRSRIFSGLRRLRLGFSGSKIFLCQWNPFADS